MTVALSGAATEAQLRSNLTAASLRLPEPFEDLAEPPEAYWRQRSSLPWT